VVQTSKVIEFATLIITGGSGLSAIIENLDHKVYNTLFVVFFIICGLMMLCGSLNKTIFSNSKVILRLKNEIDKKNKEQDLRVQKMEERSEKFQKKYDGDIDTILSLLQKK
jgi:hypothetical protein